MQSLLREYATKDQESFFEILFKVAENLLLSDYNKNIMKYWWSGISYSFTLVIFFLMQGADLEKCFYHRTGRYKIIFRAVSLIQLENIFGPVTLPSPTPSSLSFFTHLPIPCSHSLSLSLSFSFNFTPLLLSSCSVGLSLSFSGSFPLFSTTLPCCPYSPLPSPPFPLPFLLFTHILSLPSFLPLPIPFSPHFH